MNSTALVWDERYLWHHVGNGAGVLPEGGELIEPGDFGEESPHPRRRLRNLLEVSGLLDQLCLLKPRPASRDELTRVHTPSYVDRVAALARSGGGDAGGGTPFGANGYTIAALAGGGCLAAVDAVLAGTARNAYALVKPPGHHALADSGNGHCIFNNVALAAEHALAVHGLERMSILDWDVHWGNGTQELFFEDPRVQTISIHQADWYPRGGGLAGEVGRGPGVGSHLNVELPPGSGSGAYRAAFERVVGPALAQHRPDLVIVSCGYDASALDPSGRMMLTSEDFRLMTRWTMAYAEQWCDGRLLMVHEGGYAPAYVPFCGAAVIEELCGAREVIADPFLARLGGAGYADLQAHQSEAIERTLSAHSRL
ncbi:MAG TPA: class II histone deacetylase [Nocardioides bacterium]|uniref:class II histone deacetylase n=1 Tax=uncultured Nocardioides sp. TaxID=198441 RepID=UPI000EDD3EEC|nr:class II histone deacetylase [uncultured Nocardioides sp.]HCB02706.1 class II histone deacetylase [Nocardioides sp.]